MIYQQVNRENCDCGFVHFIWTHILQSKQYPTYFFFISRRYNFGHGYTRCWLHIMVDWWGTRILHGHGFKHLLLSGRIQVLRRIWYSYGIDKVQERHLSSNWIKSCYLWWLSTDCYGNLTYSPWGICDISRILATLFRPFGFIAPKTLNYLSFQSFDFKRTWWRFFQKRAVTTKFESYVFISPRILSADRQYNQLHIDTNMVT